jgi:hypothetical protein
LRTASVSSFVRCLPSGFSFLGEGSIAVVKCRWEWRWRRDGEEGDSDRIGYQNWLPKYFGLNHFLSLVNEAENFHPSYGSYVGNFFLLTCFVFVIDVKYFKCETFFPNWFCHLLIKCCNHFKCANHFLVYNCIVIVIVPWKWNRKKQTEKTIGFILITTRRNPSEIWDGIGLANSMCSSGNKLNFFFFFSGAIWN